MANSDNWIRDGDALHHLNCMQSEAAKMSPETHVATAIQMLEELIGKRFGFVTRKAVTALLREIYEYGARSIVVHEAPDLSAAAIGDIVEWPTQIASGDTSTKRLSGVVAKIADGCATVLHMWEVDGKKREAETVVALSNLRVLRKAVRHV